MNYGKQVRYIVTDLNGRAAVSTSGTIHLSEIHNWIDVKVFKEFNTAKKCIEKNPTVLKGCIVKKVEISYSDLEPDEEE